MNYVEREAGVPPEIRDVSLWKMQAYRLALFLSDLAWYDGSKLVQDPRTRQVADQLYRAVGSVSANLAEGYSRGTGADQTRFYEYARGSVRESRQGYFKSRHLLGEEVFVHRLQLLATIIRLLLTTIPQQRRRTLRESDGSYLPKCHTRATT